MVTIDRRRFVTLLGAGLVGSAAALAGCSNSNETETSTDTGSTGPTSSTGRATSTTASIDRSTVPNVADGNLAGLTFAAHRDPGCGCCLKWVEYIRENGATVEVTDDPDRAIFRKSVGIPDEAESCHTAMVDEYAIEGHVPVEAIRKLLADRPDAAGLALPGMPSDSPGMGGDHDDWVSQKVVLVTNDGVLDPFVY